MGKAAKEIPTENRTALVILKLSWGGTSEVVLTFHHEHKNFYQEREVLQGYTIRIKILASEAPSL